MSSTSQAISRSTLEDLPSYINEKVLVIGKVDSQQDSEAVFTLNDGNVTVHAGTAIEPLELGGVYQVLGKVIDDTSIKAYTVYKLPTSELPPKDFEKKLLQLRKAPVMRAIFSPSGLEE